MTDRRYYDCGELAHYVRDCSILRSGGAHQNAQVQLSRIVNATYEESKSQTPMPLLYKMFATSTLRKRFELNYGLRKNLEGILEPIPIPQKILRFGLGYIPIDGEESKANSKKKSICDMDKLILYLYQSFSIKEEDCAIILEEYITTPTI
ncbi:hypothetical protein HAX54_031924 [Datura stramonium]|uniref:CCHC-type domain-containing protein n=1 Tax=Datura stramonium TaxID=4076 RepID=A0ABS8SCA9_DATST|nr:hypothetical protein [Datura stramonium]